ncbi:MAG: hypothetical protein P8Z74_18655 [Acidobacteriota bacterium]
MKVILALTLVAPVVWGDSALYLSRARNLAQFGWPVIDNFCGPDYPPLYSILISPAFLIRAVPEVSYHLCLAINALVGTSIVFPAYLIHERLTGKAVPSLAVASIVAFLPASFVFSQSIMAENLMLPLVMWLSLAALHYPETRRGAAFAVGALASASILTKSLALGLLPGLLVLGLVTLFEARDDPKRKKRAFVSFGAMFGGLFVPWALWQGWDWLAQAHRAVPASLEGSYPFNWYKDALISAITDLNGTMIFLRALIGQLVYLFFSTFGLAAVAVVGILLFLIHRPKRSSRAPWAAFLVFSVGILFVGSVHCASYYTMSPERYSFFGRYADSAAVPLVVLGAAFLQQTSTMRKRILMIALPVGVLAACAIPYPGWIWLHRVGIFYLRPIKDLSSYRAMALVLAILPLMCAFGFWRRSWRVAAVLVLGVGVTFSSALAFSAVHAASRDFYEHHPIAGFLRNHFTTGGDQLLVAASEFKRQGCFHGQHWMLLYQTGSAFSLFSRVEDLERFPRGHDVYFATTEALPNQRAVASEGNLFLFRVRAQRLINILEEKNPDSRERTDRVRSAKAVCPSGAGDEAGRAHGEKRK